jgi:hypothetical protein
VPSSFGISPAGCRSASSLSQVPFRPPQTIKFGAGAEVRIPIYSGRGFRREAGRGRASRLKAPPRLPRTPPVSSHWVLSRVFLLFCREQQMVNQEVGDTRHGNLGHSGELSWQTGRPQPPSPHLPRSSPAKSRGFSYGHSGRGMRTLWIFEIYGAAFRSMFQGSGTPSLNYPEPPSPIRRGGGIMRRDR